MRIKVKHLAEDTDTKGGKNSDYDGRNVELEDVEVWKDFITAEDVEALWLDDPEIREAFFCTLKKKESGRTLWEPPSRGGMLNELCLEREWGALQNGLNLVFELCAKAKQKTDTPTFVRIGDGECARYISPDAEDGATAKKPDHAGYLYVSDDQYKGDATKTVHNRIPGDAKQFRKIRRDILPHGAKYDDKKKNKEAKKVLSQIHGYMDQHEARYGYLINNEELVFFRRRKDGWGQLDISDAFRHDVMGDAETGVLSSKYVLFYFHWKIANSDDPDSGWELASFGKFPHPKTGKVWIKQAKKPKSVRKPRKIKKRLFVGMAERVAESLVGSFVGLKVKLIKAIVK